MSHNVNISLCGLRVALYQRLRLPLCVRVCVSRALTGTGGNSSETGAKATSRSPADALVPEPAAPRVDTGPSEGAAPLRREREDGEKQLLEVYSNRKFKCTKIQDQNKHKALNG